MDRALARLWLACVLLAATSSIACDEGAAPAPPQSGRVEAVAAKEVGEQEFEGFCDVYHPAGSGESFAMPETDPQAEEAKGAPRWINLWATWCKPCIEEMPMLVRFKQELADNGEALALDFISVDAEDEQVITFRKEHTGLPSTLRMSDPDKLTELMGKLGLDAGAGLPIHVFVAGDGKLRCVRSGAVAESHLELVKSLLGAG